MYDLLKFVISLFYKFKKPSKERIIKDYKEYRDMGISYSEYL